jgi:hypothetical protein
VDVSNAPATNGQDVENGFEMQDLKKNGNYDVLGSFLRSVDDAKYKINYNQVSPSAPTADENIINNNSNDNDGNEEEIENRNVVQRKTGEKEKKSRASNLLRALSLKKNFNEYIPISKATNAINFFTSLSTQLYSLTALLLLGIIITMIVTAFSLKSEGNSWTTTTSDNLETKQMENLRAVTSSKGVFVQVYILYIVNF